MDNLNVFQLKNTAHERELRIGFENYLFISILFFKNEMCAYSSIVFRSLNYFPQKLAPSNEILYLN